MLVCTATQNPVFVMSSHPPALQTLPGWSVEGLVEMNNFSCWWASCSPEPPSGGDVRITQGEDNEAKGTDHRMLMWAAAMVSARLPLPGAVLTTDPQALVRKKHFLKIITLALSVKLLAFQWIKGREFSLSQTWRSQSFREMKKH